MGGACEFGIASSLRQRCRVGSADCFGCVGGRCKLPAGARAGVLPSTHARPAVRWQLLVYEWVYLTMTCMLLRTRGGCWCGNDCALYVYLCAFCSEAMADWVWSHHSPDVCCCACWLRVVLSYDARNPAGSCVWVLLLTCEVPRLGLHDGYALCCFVQWLQWLPCSLKWCVYVVGC